MQRYPPTTDASLRVFSQADGLLLKWADEQVAADTPVTVLHDRFGAVSLSLAHPVRLVTTYHSQEEAIRRNAPGSPMSPMCSLLQETPPIQRALLRVPKSLELFEYYLAYLRAYGLPGMQVAAGFMTRHFTPRILEIAGRYAAMVTQSRAHKKARLVILSDFLLPATEDAPWRERLLNQLQYNGETYQQYYGVFSAEHIDYATQFLLTEWSTCALSTLEPPTTILDVACGNGIIGAWLLRYYPGAQLTATDDFSLAVASARLNLPAGRSTALYDHTLACIPDTSQELVVINPPFHFGHENTLDVSLSLFGQVNRVLTPGGTFVVVANRHLNYATHLTGLFSGVDTVSETSKYVIYACRGPLQPKDL